MDSVKASIGMSANVHWHVTKKSYSVAVRGKVVAYVPAVALASVTFYIDKRLREQFEKRPSRRTVHALVRGLLVPYESPKNSMPELVLCNPFIYRGFVRATDLAQAQAAELVLLGPDRVIEAYELRCLDESLAGSTNCSVRRS